MAYGSNYQRGGGGNYGGNRGGGNQQSYPNSGALFPQQKKSQNSPDMTGNVVISEDVLEYILARAGDGSVKLDLAGWRRQAQSGTSFISMKINIPYSERQQDNPQYRPQQNYQQRPQAPSREERDQYGPRTQPQRGYGSASRGDYQPQGYQNQQGGRSRTAPPRLAEETMSQDDFASGDRMPDFMRDLDDDAPF